MMSRARLTIFSVRPHNRISAGSDLPAQSSNQLCIELNLRNFVYVALRYQLCHLLASPNVCSQSPVSRWLHVVRLPPVSAFCSTRTGDSRSNRMPLPHRARKSPHGDGRRPIKGWNPPRNSPRPRWTRRGLSGRMPPSATTSSMAARALHGFARSCRR